MLQLSEGTIKEIDESLDLGLSCFYHLKTGELICFPDELRTFGEIDDEVWGEDMIRVNEDPKEYLGFSAIESFVSFRLMEDFIAAISDSRTRKNFEVAILRKRPFQQFKNLLLNDPDLRQQWFAIKPCDTRCMCGNWWLVTTIPGSKRKREIIDCFS